MDEEIIIDIDKLKDDLVNYFGSATPMYPVAFMDVINVENASPEELVQIAIQNGFDLNDYRVYQKGFY